MFERLHTQAAKAYARKPKPGVGAAPFLTRQSAAEQAAKRVWTDEPSANWAQPNFPPDAGKNEEVNVLYGSDQSIIFPSIGKKWFSYSHTAPLVLWIQIH